MSQELKDYCLPIRATKAPTGSVWHIEDQVGRPLAETWDGGRANLITSALNALAHPQPSTEPAGDVVCWQNPAPDAAAPLSPSTTAQIGASETSQKWKLGNEFAPFHPSASFIDPAYRDGWNACYRAALAQSAPTEPQPQADEIPTWMICSAHVGPPKGYCHICNPEPSAQPQATAQAPVAATEPVGGEGIYESALCESQSLVLREGALYRFRRVGECAKCAAMSAASLEAYGEPPHPLQSPYASPQQSAGAPPKPESAWQPIETAPMDGTMFIGLGQPMLRLPSGAYQTHWAAFGEGSIAHLDFKAGKGPEGGFWYEESDWTNTWQPTRWMPLPPPSAEEPKL